jgi:hypothetical protein
VCQARLVERFDDGETICAVIIANTRSREREGLLPNRNALSRRFIAERTACTGPCGSEDVISKASPYRNEAFALQRTANHVDQRLEQMR